MSIMNRLRTSYVQLPGPARRLISPVLSMLPVKYRYGKTYVQYRNNILRAKTDPEFVAEWQKTRLSQVLLAANRTRHYSNLFTQLGLAEKDLRNFDPKNLSEFPILSKDELRQDPSAFLAVPASTLDIVTTGGSSGKPLTFYLDKDRSTKEWAFLLDAWSNIGFKAGMKRAVLRGVHIDHVDEKPWEIDVALGELRLSPFHMTDKWMAKYCDLIVENDIQYLHGYPSALSIFASFVIRAGRKDLATQICGVICASEQLHDHQRAMMEEAFGTSSVMSFFGLSEKVLFAVQLPSARGQFEFDPLYGIAELVDETGAALELQGEEGNLLGTGLLFKGMPLIRYDTNDRAHLVMPASRDNGYRAVMEKIAGRWTQEYLVGSSGEMISMTAINVHSPAYAAMQSFQFYQDQPGKVVLRVVLARGHTTDDVAPFIREISQKVGKSLVFDVVMVDTLVQSERGKIKFIDQKINLKRSA
jgi:phenylacetate-CoA ligase